MDVLVGAVDKLRIRPPALEDVGERVLDSARLVAGEDAGVCQRARPRDAARHIVLEEAAIEAERGAELEGLGIRRRVEAAGPEISHQSSVVSRQSTNHRSARLATDDWRLVAFGAFRAAVSTGRPQILMKPTAAVWS